MTRLNKKAVVYFMIFLLMLIPLLSVYVETANNQRVIQHLNFSEKLNTAENADDYSSHLPIVDIITGDEYANIKIYDSLEELNRLDNIATIDSQAILSVEEEQTQEDARLVAYKFNFVNGTQPAEIEVMGMTAHSEWSLRGPIRSNDSLIKDYVYFNIAGQIVPETPDVRFCEVFEDGDYKGVYLLMETVSVGEGRIDITPYSNTVSDSSYILELDVINDNFAVLESYSSVHKKILRQTELQVVYPLEAKEDGGLLKNIEDSFMNFERNLFSYDFSDNQKGYIDYIDVSSFVDYFIINEFFYNLNAGNQSVYLYKDLYGKINLAPIWDFDTQPLESPSFKNFLLISNDQSWYFMLSKDMEFINQVIERYKILSQTLLNDEYVNKMIDDTVAFLGDSINKKVIEDYLEKTKIYIENRSNWLDENIEVLKRYGHESKNKEYHH